jgi:signal transduction histidine kinase
VFVIALLFNPLRLKVKRIVDVVFYREKFVFDKAVADITHKIRECNTTQNLGIILTEEVGRLIPVTAIAVLSIAERTERGKVLSQKNITITAGNMLAAKIKEYRSAFDIPFAQEKRVEKDVLFNDALENVLKVWNINIVIPLSVEKGEVIGAIVLSDKLSGLRFNHYDVELLNTISVSAALALKKLELQKKLIEEEVENLRLMELSEQKSYFAASVSHDLKTPLTAIRMFAELLQNKKVSKEKAADYLKILIGETGRLNRLIDNVLDFAKIERGTKEYRFGIVDLNEIVKDTLALFDYELRIQKFKTNQKYSQEKLNIWADADAVKSVLMNLLSNAIKYSNECKEIRIITVHSNNSAMVTIEDKGIGIAENQLQEIFDPFFRGEHKNVKGAGLGLSIVKHVMDSHHGEIKTASRQGEGSIFKLIFPLKTI